VLSVSAKKLKHITAGRRFTQRKPKAEARPVAKPAVKAAAAAAAKLGR
jgi:hypothetical protein